MERTSSKNKNKKSQDTKRKNGKLILKEEELVKNLKKSESNKEMDFNPIRRDININFYQILNYFKEDKSKLKINIFMEKDKESIEFIKKENKKESR